MNVVKEIQRLNAREAQLSTSHSLSGSWHDQYKDSAHIFVGGLPFHLTEGDIICVLSQFGELAGINLVRDKETGKSRGFAFLKYVDQRSTILAVDNMNGAQIGGRTIRVDHVQNYKVPKVFDEDGNEVEPDEETINNAAPKPIVQESEGDDDDSSDESEVDDKGIDIDDPMREYLLKKRRKEAQKAKRKAEKKEGKKSSASKAERRAKKEQKKASKKLQEGDNGLDADIKIEKKEEDTQDSAIKKEEQDPADKLIKKEEDQSVISPASATADRTSKERIMNKLEDLKIKREEDSPRTRPLSPGRSERSRDGREDRSGRRYDSRRSSSRSPPRRSYRDRSRSRSPSYRDRRRGGRDSSLDRRDRGYSGRDSYSGSGSRRRRSPSPAYRSSRRSRSRSPPPRSRGEYSRRSPSPRRRRSSRSPSPARRLSPKP